jgi:hypothetical protein
MKTWIKTSIITVLVGVPAFVLGPVIWPPAADAPVPSSTQLPFFMAVSAAEALAFGLGISFLAFGLPLVRKVANGSRLRAWAMYLSISWLLVSWWPHDNMHIHNGNDLQGLLYIEYGFHVTLMAAGLVLAYSLLTMLRAGDAGGLHAGAATARVR